MEKIRAKIAVSFRVKVLVPVIGVMVLLMALTMSVLNYRLTRQAEAAARETLETAGAVFQDSQKIHTRNLFLRFRNVPNEPRYKSALQTRDPETIRGLLAAAMAEHETDFVLFTPNSSVPAPQETADANAPQLQKRDHFTPDAAFETGTAMVVSHALDGEEKVDTVRIGDKLFNVVCVPVRGVGNVLIGALTFGEEVGWIEAQEFSTITHEQIVLLTGNHVIASSLLDSKSNQKLADIFKTLSQAAGTGESFGVTNTVLDDERYFCSGGRFSSFNNDTSLGFLTLHSSEDSFRALHGTQQVLLLVSLGAIVIGSIVVCFLVGKVTAPLRELRDSVEAVGKGDFSRRVEIRSEDECGELGRVFNQMTENLKLSREQLEATVDTLKTTQAQLIQSEKLSAIGEFIAGVAHELNNPLASVMGFSELLSMAPDANPKHKRHIEMIHKCAQRCQKIVQALLSFARRRAPERKAVCVNTVVEAAVEILTYQLRTSNVELRLQLDPKLPHAMVDPHLIQQVFVNIINNARQAIEAHQPGGWIRVVSESHAGMIRITIQDSGPGIAPENLSKIFDPFFTTKEVGQGTGLGLSMCYGIIKDHGGVITPRSKPGEGATFVIELPVTHELARETEEKKSSGNTDFIHAGEGSGKKVLVIDDEEPILQMVREALVPRGYEVDIAADGETALRHLHRTRYDVMLCDWKMPGLNGREVYERVRSTSPEQAEKFIFITGDVVNDRTRKFFEDQKRPCLAKPFSLREFRSAIRKVTSN